MPSDSAAEQLTHRGQAYARRGEYGKAVEAFTGAIDLSPDDADLYFHRGNASVALGRLDEAVADFTDAVNRKPDFVAAYHNRATAQADRDLPTSEAGGDRIARAAHPDARLAVGLHA